MSETNDQAIRPLLAGVVLLQQIILELLIRQDAIGYHQAREFLVSAAGVFEQARGIPAEAVKPLRAAIDMLDDLHRPLPAGEHPHAPNWLDQLRRNGLL
jgi:hypothetical protein